MRGQAYCRTITILLDIYSHHLDAAATLAETEDLAEIMSITAYTHENGFSLLLLDVEQHTLITIAYSTLGGPH
jgi:hypothetical protein